MTPEAEAVSHEVLHRAAIGAAKRLFALERLLAWKYIHINIFSYFACPRTQEPSRSANGPNIYQYQCLYK